MADGYIEFSTTLDNSDLEKQLKAAEKEIDALKAKIEKKESESNAIEEEMQKANAAIDATIARIEKLKERYAELSQSDDAGARARREVIAAEIDKEYKGLEKQYTALEKIDSKWSNVQADLSDYTARLNEAKDRYALLGQTAQQEASRSQGVFANMSNSISTSMSALVSKVNMAFRRMILFGLILGGINAIKNAVSSIIAGNKQFGASVANLRAVLRGYLASMVQTVLPAIISAVNTLAALFERIANFVDSFFGTNIAGAISQQRSAIMAGNADDAANATNSQAKAAKKLAKEQKKANRQLLAFDELNVLAAEDANDMVDAMGDSYSDPGGDVLGGLQDFGMFQSVLDWLDEIRRRIETDVVGPFARIREGLVLIKQGIGELAQGIMTGDWALAWQGFADIVTGAVYVIQGTLTAFFDWLDELTDGRFSLLFEGLSTFLQGVSDLIDGLLHGDIELAIQGIFEMADGLLTALEGAVQAVLTIVGLTWDNAKQLLHDGVDNFINYLEKKYPELTGYFEKIRDFLHGVIDTIDKSIHNALDVLSRAVSGFADGAKQIVEGLLNFIVGLVTIDGERIKQGIKGILNGIFQLAESAINMVIDGLSGLINHAISGLNHLPGVYLPTVSLPRVSIPRLGSGAVIPPNREFMAVLGDQTNGQNLEAPESLIRQIVREETSNAQAVTLLAQILAAVQAGNVIEVDGMALGKATRSAFATQDLMGGY